MEILDTAIVALYFVGMMILAIMVRRAKSFNDFARGSQKIPATIVFASLSATFIGPGYSMGLINKAGTGGYIWLLIFLAFSVQMLLVGYFIAPRLRKFSNAFTVGDVMGERYGSSLKLISGIFSVLLCIGFVGVIAKASGDLVNGLTGIPFVWSVIISTLVVVIYSTYGGMKAVVITDTVQFIVLATIIPLLFVFVDFGNNEIEISSILTNMDLTKSESFSVAQVLGLSLGFFLGETLIPPYTNRALIAKDSKTAKRGFLASGFFSISWFLICASIGVLGAILIPQSDNLFISLLKTYLPVGIFGLAVAAMISIIMSSQDSLLNAASVSLYRDVLSVLFNRKFATKDGLKTTRWVNLILGTAAIFFAINVPSIIDALLYCYTLWAPTIVLPLIIAVLYSKAKPIAALWSIIIGLVTTGLWEWGLNDPPYGIPSLLVGVLANQLTFWLIQISIKKSLRINY